MQIKMKYNVVKVGPKILRDYDGQNYYSAKAMGFKGYPMRKNTILIDKRFGKKRAIETIRHEKIEAQAMKRGLKYWDAHRLALKHQGGK